ncbi:uncharacterized protein [Dysidea avara]|uniref:uncharacterized protein n=1 Tax=Dysidea avara TaxID=196820 RepID=UPI00331C83A6
MFQVSVSSVMNFRVSLLRCIRHSVDGFKQISSVDCSGIKGVNFQCLLDCVIRYRNKCFLVLLPMFQVSVSSVMNFSYQLSLYTSDVNLQVSLLRCIGYSVDGFKQISSVDCSGIKGVNFYCTVGGGSVHDDDWAMCK